MLTPVNPYLPFSRSLNQYFNSGCLGRKDVLLSVISHRFVFRKNAKKLIRLFNSLLPLHENKGETVKINVDVYKGGNPYVLKMRAFLEEKIKQQLVGAYIHGSIGTGEETAYSDFDGLLIVKDAVFTSPNQLAGLARHINGSRKIMKQSDPFQHHGWFVISEKEMNNNYPQAFFPPELFRFAQSVFPDKGLRLQLKINHEETDFSKPFFELADSILRKLRNRKRPENRYALKNLLSEFMLLPSLYVQAKTKRGIFKKFSFEEAKKDFSAGEWAVMEEVSQIRNEWKTGLTTIHRLLLQTTHPFFFKLAVRLLPGIKENIADEKLYADMLNLVSAMKKRMVKD